MGRNIMRIWTEIAYCRNQSNKDLGFYYNEIKDKYKGSEYKDDWICLLDHDARFLNDRWYPIMEKHIKKSGDEFKLFTCLTNRIGNKVQRIDEMWDEDRNLQHFLFSNQLDDGILHEMPKQSPISGVLLLFPCHLNVRFRELGRCLGVDNYFHWDIIDNGYKAGLMMDLYVYHWYRFNKGHENVDHLN